MSTTSRTLSALLLTASTLLAHGLPLHAQGQTQTPGKRLYKWVDEQGNIHYSDRLEGAATSRNPERLSTNGIRVGAQHSALPTNREEAKQYEEARRRAQRDAMLLSSYPSEIELLRAHDELRVPIETSLRAAQENIERLRGEIRSREAVKGVPEQKAAEIQQLRRQLAEEELRLKELEAKRFDLYEQQNAEVARYRELVGAGRDG